MPPPFSQSAAFFACVTSPAKAGPVKASANANANVDTSIFMVLLLTVGGGRQENSVSTTHVPSTTYSGYGGLFGYQLHSLLQTQFSIRGRHSSGGNATMSHLFAAILLFSSPGCPHE